MNGALRHGNIKGQDEDIATMDKAIAKADLKEDIIVRRLSSPELLGLKTNSLEEFNKANLIGAIVSDKAYVSTAVIGEGLMKYNSSVSYRIKVPKGKGRGAYISNVAKIRGEFEYVIKRGSSFRITGARKVGKFLQVDMEVIDE